MIKARFFESQEAYDEYSESRGGYMHEQVTAIIRANGTICADLITDCKRWQTAVKRFFDAVAGDSRFAGWRETITESINGGVWEDRESVDGGYVYGGYAWGVEEVAPGTYYIFLNVPAPQQPAQPEAEQEAEEKTAAQDITTKYYTPSAHISIFLNTWGNYNENGADGGLWISLPCDIEDMLQRLAESTGEDADEMEPFINDSETDIDELEIGELDDIRGLNDLAEQLDELDEWELEQLAAYMEAEGGTLENALENYEDCAFYEGSRLIDVAYELADEMLADAPEFCQNYFDYEAFARDLGFDGYRETSRGVICTR